MSELPPEQPTTLAEQRLLILLEALRREAADGDDATLVGSVMRQVRIQSLLRELLSAVGGLTSAVREAFTILLAARRGGNR